MKSRVYIFLFYIPFLFAQQNNFQQGNSQQQQQGNFQQQPQGNSQQQQQGGQNNNQQSASGGNLFVLPSNSLQPEQKDTNDYNFRGSSSSATQGSGKNYEETKYNHFKPEHVSNTCQRQKKILLDVNNAGFGNKLLAIVSTGVLATLTNRILELDWDGMNNYQTIFQTIPQQQGAELFRDDNSTASNNFEVVGNECAIKLTPVNDFMHFWFLRHPALFQRLDQNCDIIKIVGNSYYIPFLMDPAVFNNKGTQLKTMFGENPFKSLSTCHLKPNQRLQEASSKIINEMRSTGGKWMSIHARAYYDYSGKASSKAFTCAKKLLELGTIKKVYFATESMRLIDIAKKYFEAFPGALYISDKMIQKQEGNATNIDNEVNVDEAHVVEWLTIGEADFCLSPTFELSSFSNTGLFRGPCTLIPIKAYKDCDLYLNNLAGGIPKRLIFSALNHPRAIRTWSKPVDLEKVWNSISIVNATNQCLKNIPDNTIGQYWAAQQC